MQPTGRLQSPGKSSGECGLGLWSYGMWEIDILAPDQSPTFSFCNEACWQVGNFKDHGGEEKPMNTVFYKVSSLVQNLLVNTLEEEKKIPSFAVRDL